ncbi:MAG: Lrp/AsnC family transcriptional regulator [Enterobacterales bacterium]|nr:Lrp/AsnC family transcriptional regulator [Enterobacterales bacterium]
MKKLTPIDLDILAHLYRDPQISNKDLAAKVKIAASTCHERVKRLESSGVIKSATLEIDFKSIGGNIEAMTAVRLNKHSSCIIDDFKNDLVKCDEVIRIYHMGGENDFMLHTTVRDTQHLRDFVFRAITSRSEVVHIETALVYEQVSSQTFPAFSQTE